MSSNWLLRQRYVSWLIMHKTRFFKVWLNVKVLTEVMISSFRLVLSRTNKFNIAFFKLEATADCFQSFSRTKIGQSMCKNMISRTFILNYAKKAVTSRSVSLPTWSCLTLDETQSKCKIRSSFITFEIRGKAMVDDQAMMQCLLNVSSRFCAVGMRIRSGYGALFRNVTWKNLRMHIRTTQYSVFRTEQVHERFKTFSAQMVQNVVI